MYNPLNKNTIYFIVLSILSSSSSSSFKRKKCLKHHIKGVHVQLTYTPHNPLVILLSEKFLFVFMTALCDTFLLDAVLFFLLTFVGECVA